MLPRLPRGAEPEVQAGAALPHLVGEAAHPGVARKPGPARAVRDLKDLLGAKFEYFLSKS